MDSVTIERHHVDYQSNTSFTFNGTIKTSKSYRINYSDEYVYEGRVDQIFLDPDGDELIELHTVDGNLEFIPASGIYEFEVI